MTTWIGQEIEFMSFYTMNSIFYCECTGQNATKIPLCAMIKVRSATAYLSVSWNQLKGLKG